MKASVIIAIYKDIQALDVIIKALKNQTYSNFEVIVAEDGNDPSVQQFIRTVEGLDIKHTYQEDRGIRKSRSQNNAILASSGEYLIFIDGDCIPYSTFVGAHHALNEKGKVLSGRRVNLGAEVSDQIRKGIINPFDLEKNFFTNYFRISNDQHASHVEQGLYIKPNGFLYNKISKNRSASILGCNFSLFKEDMMAINGFDESYENSSLGDDVDLSWRFEAAGILEKSCKNVANQFHLHHDRDHQNKDASEQLELMNQRMQQKEYFTKNGLNLH